MISATVKNLYDLKKQCEYNILKKLMTRQKIKIVYSPLSSITQNILDSKAINNFINVVHTDQIFKDNLKSLGDLLYGIENGQRQYFNLISELVNNVIIYYVKMAKYEPKYKNKKFIIVTNSYKFFEMSKCKKFILMPDYSMINFYETDQTKRNNMMININEIEKVKHLKYFQVLTTDEIDNIIIKKIIKPKKSN